MLYKRDDAVKLIGDVTVAAYDQHGNRKAFYNGQNLITDAGKYGIASRINGASGETVFTYIAVGESTASATVGDTQLGNEITGADLARVVGTATLQTTTVTDDTAQLATTFNVTGSYGVTEAGILNASSNGTLLGRRVFSAVNVLSGDTLQIIYKIIAA